LANANARERNDITTNALGLDSMQNNLPTGTHPHCHFRWAAAVTAQGAVITRWRYRAEQRL
jgi:hypothetical protein